MGIIRWQEEGIGEELAHDVTVARRVQSGEHGLDAGPDVWRGEHGGVEQDDARKPIRLLCRQLNGDSAPHAVPDYERPLEVAFAANPREVVGKRGDSVRLPGLVAPAMPSEVNRYDPVVSAEVGELWGHEGVITAPAMHEDEGRPVVTRILIEQRYTIALKPRHRGACDSDLDTISVAFWLSSQGTIPL